MAPSCFALRTLSGIHANICREETLKPYLLSIWEIFGPQGGNGRFAEWALGRFGPALVFI
jgi:hypothetical protein